MSSPFVDVVTRVCAELDRQGIRYALTGSVVSSVYGEPFASQDVDICVNMTENQARSLASALPMDFYRSDVGLVEAVRSRSMSNLVDIRTQLKLDLSVLADDPYFDRVMSRRQGVQLEAGSSKLWAVSPEDIVLMKLLWRKESRSSKQWENALSVMKVQRGKLDYSYMREWSEKLGIQDDLVNLIKESHK